MGCFLACFGLSNKRKRRKTLHRVLSRHQKYNNYEVLAITEKSIVPYSDFRANDECKEQNSVKSKKKKKKVTFNLNVQIYEPNPAAYQVLDNEEEENENTTEGPEGRSSHSSTLGEGSAALTMRYPSNYRYYNCIDGYDEVDEIAYDESDIDDYSDDDEFDDGYDSDDGGTDESFGNDEGEVYRQNTRQKELAGSCYSSVAEDRIKDQVSLAPNEIKLKSNSSGRDRSISMHSVLSPVENVTQWKAIKADSKVTSSKHGRKENVPSEQNTNMPLVSEASLNFSPCSLESNVLQSKPLLQEIAVDASLSNWLTSHNYNASKATIHCQ